MTKLNKPKAVELLNKIMELELAGVVRYTHYSLMVFGYNRIPIVSWLRSQADESLLHAQQAGEFITHFGGHPTLGIGPLLETEQHDIGDILRESLEHEKMAGKAYEELYLLVKDKSIMLEDYAQRLIAEEEAHRGEVDKMLRSPGDVAAYDS